MAEDEAKNSGDLTIRELFLGLKTGELVGVLFFLATLFGLGMALQAWIFSISHDEAAESSKLIGGDDSVVETSDRLLIRLERLQKENVELSKKNSTANEEIKKRDELISMLNKNSLEHVNQIGNLERIISESKSSPQSSPRLGRVNEASESHPAMWADYEGFEYLIGSWVGKVVGGPIVEMSFPQPDRNDVYASIKLQGTSCSMSVKMDKATEAFSSSTFYMLVNTSTSACPDIEYVKLALPTSEGMYFTILEKSGKQIVTVLSRRI